MLNHATAQIFVCLDPVDMRKSFDTLAQLVRDQLGHDPLSGSWFIFRGKARDRLKILYWDRDGYAIWQKRLETGTFQLPANGLKLGCLEIQSTDLALILSGIDLDSARRRRRFALPDRRAV
jgi:transposase